MKYIIYILIALFFVQILASAMPNNKDSQNSEKETQVENSKTVTVYCKTSNPTAIEFNSSAQIIEKRLKSFGIKNYQILTQVSDASIKIVFGSEQDLSAIKTLITSQGKVEFYKTVNSLKYTEKISENALIDQFQTTLNKEEHNPELIGYSRSKTLKLLDNKFKALSNNKYKIMSSHTPEENGKYSVYLLESRAFLSNKDVSKSKLVQGEYNQLNISFTKTASDLFEQITQENLGKSIAFAIDNEVYWTPVIHSVIKGGKCTISGGFFIPELEVINALIKHPEIPLEFEIR